MKRKARRRARRNRNDQRRKEEDISGRYAINSERVLLKERPNPASGKSSAVAGGWMRTGLNLLDSGESFSPRFRYDDLTGTQDGQAHLQEEGNL